MLNGLAVTFPTKCNEIFFNVIATSPRHTAVTLIFASFIAYVLTSAHPSRKLR
jgi:hypothetical protein